MIELMERHSNPCIKTGCTVATAGDVWWHGDLFDFGNYYMLNCAAAEHHTPVDGRVHMQAVTWQATHQDRKVVVFHKDHVQWFDYEGRIFKDGRLAE